MMNFCPEIAVLQSALFLTNKQRGEKSKDTKAEAGPSVSVLCEAVQEISRGLEGDNCLREQLTWNRHMYSVLLYKVIDTHYKEAQQGADRGAQGGAILDKAQALSTVLPPISKAVFLELVKRCQWFDFYFISLSSIDEKVARCLLGDTVNHVCEGSSDEEDLHWGRLFIDYFISCILTSQRRGTDQTSGANRDTDMVTQNSTNPSESQRHITVNNSLQSNGLRDMEISLTNQTTSLSDDGPGEMLCGLLTAKEMCQWLEHILMAKIQKSRKEENLKCPVIQHENEQQLLCELCHLFFMGVVFCPKSPDLFSQIAQWTRFNLWAVEQDPSICSNLPAQMLGKYSKDLTSDSDLGLASWLCGFSIQRFPWKSWIEALQDIFASITLPCVSLDVGSFSFCRFVHLVQPDPVYVSVECRPRRILSMAVTVLQQYTAGRHGDDLSSRQGEKLTLKQELEVIIGNLFKEFKKGSEQLTGTGDKFNEEFEKDWTLSALTWRIKNRLPYCSEALKILVTTFDPELWSDNCLLSTLSDAMDILSTPALMVRFYELVVHVANTMDPQRILQLKQLVLTAFSYLPCAVQDEHISLVYTRYTHWPHHHGNQLDGLLTTTLNKLTMEHTENEKVTSELCQLALQDVEMVVQGIVGRAISSPEQAELAVKVLARMSLVASGRTEGCSLCRLLSRYLTTTRLSPKERRGLLHLIRLAVVPLKTGEIEDQPHSLLNAAELIQTTALPHLDCLSHSNPHQPMDAMLSLEIIINILESLKCRRISLAGVMKSLATDSSSWLLGVAELWQYCMVLWDSEDITKGRVKEHLIQFSSLLVSLGGSCDFSVNCPDRMWLHRHLEQLDWSVQVRVAEVVRQVSFQKECEDLCCVLINNPGVCLNLLRAAAICDVMMECVVSAVRRYTVGLQYEDVVLALVQLCPNCVCEEWKRITQTLQRLVYGGHLHHQDQPTTSGVHVNLPDLQRTLRLSQILHDVMTFVQFTDIATNMAALLHCAKCYVAVVKDCIVASSTTAEERVILLTKVFRQVCGATYWLPMEALDPVDVLLLDIICSLETVREELDTTLVSSVFHDSLKCISESCRTVLNLDTKNMLHKKISELLA